LKQLNLIKRKDIPFYDSLLTSSSGGRIYSLIAIDGTGKTTLLKMLKERFFNSGGANEELHN
jgi:ABC-type cobalamin/Fe3+-siderophores transport system ATPase subunit